MDIETTFNGDIVLDAAQANRLNIIDFINQRVKHILRSKPGDWKLSLNSGANVAQYVGYPVIPSTKRVVEENLTAEFRRDQVLKNFPIQIIFTPASQDSAIIEIIISLPDGTELRIQELLQTTGTMIGLNEPLFKEAEYDTSNPITIAEVVELTSRTNIFELKYLPFDSSVFVIPLSELPVLDELGHVNPSQFTSGQTFVINFTLPWDAEIQTIYPYIISGGVEVIVDNEVVSPANFSHTGTQIIINGYSIDTVVINVTYDISGEVLIQQTEEDLDTRQTTFLFNAGLTDILNNKLVQSIEVEADGEIISNDLFVANSSFITLQQAYKEQVIVTVGYTNNHSITSVNELSMDSKPLNLFPRSRFTKRYMVTTRQLFEPGTYFVQYSSFALL